MRDSIGPIAAEVRLAGARRRDLGDAARAALRRATSFGLVFRAIRPDPKPERRRQSQIPVPHRRSPRCGLACRTGGAPRTSATCCGAIRNDLRRPAAAGRDQPCARGETAICCSPTNTTGNLDEATADEVLALARDLVARTGCSLLMVTHGATSHQRSTADQPSTPD